MIHVHFETIKRVLHYTGQTKILPWNFNSHILFFALRPYAHKRNRSALFHVFDEQSYTLICFSFYLSVAKPFHFWPYDSNDFRCYIFSIRFSKTKNAEQIHYHIVVSCGFVYNALFGIKNYKIEHMKHGCESLFTLT